MFELCIGYNYFIHFVFPVENAEETLKYPGLFHRPTANPGHEMIPLCLLAGGWAWICSIMLSELPDTGVVQDHESRAPRSRTRFCRGNLLPHKPCAGIDPTGHYGRSETVCQMRASSEASAVFM